MTLLCSQGSCWAGEVDSAQDPAAQRCVEALHSIVKERIAHAPSTTRKSLIARATAIAENVTFTVERSCGYEACDEATLSEIINVVIEQETKDILRKKSSRRRTLLKVLGASIVAATGGSILNKLVQPDLAAGIAFFVGIYSYKWLESVIHGSTAHYYGEHERRGFPECEVTLRRPILELLARNYDRVGNSSTEQHHWSRTLTFEINKLADAFYYALEQLKRVKLADTLEEQQLSWKIAISTLGTIVYTLHELHLDTVKFDIFLTNSIRSGLRSLAPLPPIYTDLIAELKIQDPSIIRDTQRLESYRSLLSLWGITPPE